MAMVLDPRTSRDPHFPGFGPMDQGLLYLLNKFYAGDLQARILSQGFNAKPYNDLLPTASIVHFHGPKPHDYAGFTKSNACRFEKMCHAGFSKALCPYVQELFVHLPYSCRAARLDAACEWIMNPALKSLLAEKWGLH